MRETMAPVQHDAAAIMLENQLLERLKLVVEWVKFAEAKNGALVTVGTAGFLALVKAVPPASKAWTVWVNGCQLWTLIWLTIGIVPAFLSFMPQTGLDQVLRQQLQKRQRSSGDQATQTHREEENLYFYEKLAEFSGAELVRRIAASHLTPIGLNSTLVIDNQLEGYLRESHRDLAEQIVANSRIASRKFALFRYAARLVLVSLVPVPVLFVFTIIAPGGA